MYIFPALLVFSPPSHFDEVAQTYLFCFQIFPKLKSPSSCTWTPLFTKPMRLNPYIWRILGVNAGFIRPDDLGVVSPKMVIICYSDVVPHQFFSSDFDSGVDGTDSTCPFSLVAPVWCNLDALRPMSSDTPWQSMTHPFHLRISRKKKCPLNDPVSSP